MRRTAPITADYTPLGRALIEALARRPGQWVSFATIIRELWDNEDDDGYRNNLRPQASKLRSAEVKIDCMVGRGYRLPVVPLCKSCGRPLEGEG